MSPSCTTETASDPPRRERSAIADAVNLVQDRYPGVPRAQKVSMEGVNRAVPSAPVTYRASRSDQRFGGHLAAEDPKSLLVRAEAPVQVYPQGLEVEKVD